MHRRLLLSMLAVMLSGCTVFCPPAWSPDGRYVAAFKYTSSGDGLRPRLTVFDMQEGEVKRPKFEVPLQAVWGPEELYVCSSEEQNVRIFMLRPPDFELQELALPPGDVYWAAPLADGSGICYARFRSRDTADAVYFSYHDVGETVLAKDACFPAASLDGGHIYAGGRKDGKLVLYRFDVADGNVTGPSAALDLPGAEGDPEGYPLPVPAEKGVVCFVPGANSVWVVDPAFKSARRYPAPGPVRYAAATSGGDKVRLVLELEGEAEGFVGAVLDLKAGKTKLDGPVAATPYGFGRWNPDKTVYAEVGRGGLKIEPVTGGWIRYLPETPQEHLVAAEELLPRSPLEAVYFLSDRPVGVDGFRWHLVSAEAAAKTNRDRASARSFLEGILRYPVTDMEPGVVLARLKNVVLGVDEAAIKASELLEAEPDRALKVLDELEKMLASEDLLAGISFRRGFAQFRKADFANAARSFRRAAECDIFPQRDYAAVLSMIAYHLEGRKDLSNDMTAMVKAKFGGKSAAVSLDAIRQLLGNWAERPVERKFDLKPDVCLLTTEKSDYRLRLSLDHRHPVAIDRIARLHLCIVTRTPQDPNKDEVRRDIKELPGFFAGFAKRSDNQVFAVVTISGKDVPVLVGSLPGHKVLERTYQDAFKDVPDGTEAFKVEFSPSGARLTIEGADFKQEVGSLPVIPGKK